MDFDQLYKEQFPVVYRYLTGLCGNQALAEELTQETFCRAIEHSASFQGKCRLSVWLCQIGKNCWLSYLRKAKRQTGDEVLEQMPSPQNVEEDLLIQENARQIHQRLHALPEPYREVLLQSRNHTKCSRFPAAGRSDKDDKFVIMDFQIKILYRVMLFVIGFAYISQCNF